VGWLIYVVRFCRAERGDCCGEGGAKRDRVQSRRLGRLCALRRLRLGNEPTTKPRLAHPLPRAAPRAPGLWPAYATTRRGTAGGGVATRGDVTSREEQRDDVPLEPSRGRGRQSAPLPTLASHMVAGSQTTSVCKGSTDGAHLLDGLNWRVTL
jgi:hypothetical protein